MRYKIILTLFTLLSSFIALNAEEVSRDKALAYAKSFFQANDPVLTRGSDVKVQLVLVSMGTATKGNSDPALYIFNRTDREGFVIISGDSSTPPVLGYSITGNFVTENMPTNIKN